MKHHLLIALLLLSFPIDLHAAEHLIHPGDSPQAILDRAAPGDRLVFLPGLHLHSLGKHRSILYVDKSVEIELQDGATLKLAPGVTKLEADGEITTDQDAGKKLDDLEVGGQFDITRPAVDGPEAYGAAIYSIITDGIGSDGNPDAFAWGDGKLFETPNKKVAITGDWQELNHGVKIRFSNRTGHSLRSVWFVSYDGHPSFRGHLRNVRCNFNYMETGKTAIEPNFNLDGYEVIGNVIKSDGQAIHCWRHSAHGVIADNPRIHDNTGKPVVVVNAPAGWQPPEPPVLRNNRNHLSDGPAK